MYVLKTAFSAQLFRFMFPLSVASLLRLYLFPYCNDSLLIFFGIFCAISLVA